MTAVSIPLETGCGLTEDRRIRLSDLKVDESYQRGSKNKWKSIISKFDRTVLGKLLVGQRRDGSLWIVDGLQRSLALNKLGEEWADCTVFHSDGPEHEAMVFKKANDPKTRMNMSPADLFRAMEIARDPVAIVINEVSNEFGLHVSKHRGGPHTPDETRSKKLTCIATLIKIVSEWGTEPLQFSFKVITESWPSDPRRTEALIVGGLALFYYRHRDSSVSGVKGPLDTGRLIRRLQDMSPLVIFQKARGQSDHHFSGDRYSRTCEVIEEIYRRRKVGD